MRTFASTLIGVIQMTRHNSMYLPVVIVTMKSAWIILKCGLLLMWFHLLTCIDVLEAKIVSLADGAWQSVLDCIDRFAAFNLDGQSAC